MNADLYDSLNSVVPWPRSMLMSKYAFYHIPLKGRKFSFLSFNLSSEETNLQTNKPVVIVLKKDIYKNNYIKDGPGN